MFIMHEKLKLMCPIYLNISNMQKTRNQHLNRICCHFYWHNFHAIKFLLYPKKISHAKALLLGKF